MSRWLIVAPQWEYEIEFSAGCASVQRRPIVARGLDFSYVILDEAGTQPC